jgi:hypothetical protein
MKLVVILITALFLISCSSCSNWDMHYPKYTPDPPINVKKQENFRLLAKAEAPVVVVSVVKTHYRTIRNEYVLYDVRARDANGILFVFAATDWAGLNPGYVLKSKEIIYGDENK